VLVQVGSKAAIEEEFSRVESALQRLRTERAMKQGALGSILERVRLSATLLLLWQWSALERPRCALCLLHAGCQLAWDGVRFKPDCAAPILRSQAGKRNAGQPLVSRWPV
jgi:hypothetical protein